MANNDMHIEGVDFANLSKNELNLFFAILTRMHHLRRTSVVFNYDELQWLTDDTDTDFNQLLTTVIDHISQTSTTYDLGDGPVKHDFFSKIGLVNDQQIVSVQLNPDFEFLVQIDEAHWKK